MPIYDLRCQKCGSEHSISASMKDKTENKIACPGCGSVDLKSVFKSSPAFIKKEGSDECPNRHKCGGGCCHS